MNLILAIFWLVVGAGLLLYPLINPGGPRVDIGDSGISLGWVGIALFAYNLLRWWLQRNQRRERETLNEPTGRRRNEPEYLPEFDFNKPDDKK